MGLTAAAGMRALLFAAFAGVAVLAGGGCGGGAAPPPDCPNDLPPSCPDPAPTFSADAEPAIAAKCTGCHSPTGVESNRPFTNYGQIFGQRGSILNQVHACRMPPVDAPPLTAGERAALLGWLVCGAPND